MQLSAYRRDDSLGHCLGSFAVLELLRHRPRKTRLVVLPDEDRVPVISEIAELCERHGVEIHRDDGLLRRIGHRRDIDAFALFSKYRERIDFTANQLVLLSPAGPGNLGTILRSMVAFGTSDLALVGPSVDPFSPHVIRASIGARFQVRIEEFATLAEYRERRSGPLHLFTADAEQSLERVRFPSPFTLVFGPEWPGLPAEASALGTPVAIPQSAAVESLNLGVAVSIALYAARFGASGKA